jgi:hypothetical protein
MKEATFADGRPPINRGARRESEDSVNEDE